MQGKCYISVYFPWPLIWNFVNKSTFYIYRHVPTLKALPRHCRVCGWVILWRSHSKLKYKMLCTFALLLLPLQSLLSSFPHRDTKLTRLGHRQSISSCHHGWVHGTCCTPSGSRPGMGLPGWIWNPGFSHSVHRLCCHPVESSHSYVLLQGGQFSASWKTGGEFS